MLRMSPSKFRIIFVDRTRMMEQPGGVKDMTTSCFILLNTDNKCNTQTDRQTERLKSGHSDFFFSLF